jgi:hypothetical protein
MKLCECGCGQEVKENKRFIHSHNMNTTMFMEKVKIDRKNRKVSEETRKKISEASKGRHHNEETKKKMSEAKKGKKGHTAWNKGKEGIYSEEYRKKISESKLGKSLSEEHKQKISNAMKGMKLHKLSEEQKKKIGERTKGNKYWVGRKHTLESRQKMSLVQTKDKEFTQFRREQNQEPRKDLEYVEWRKKVLIRDNFKCQLCENIGGILHAHHIFPFIKVKELRLNVNNGITLCKKCHENVHRKENENEI